MVNRFRSESRSRTAPSSPQAERVESGLPILPQTTTSPESPSPESPVAHPSQKVSDRLQSSRRSPRRVNSSREAGPSRVTSDRLKDARTGQGRVKSRGDAYNAAAAGERSRPRTADGTSKDAGSVAKRITSGRSDLAPQSTQGRSSDKLARAKPERSVRPQESRGKSQARPPAPSLSREHATEPRSRSHTAKVQAALQALPSAPTHDPQQMTALRPGRRKVEGAPTNSEPAPRPTEARSVKRSLKRTRSDDGDQAAPATRSKSTPSKSSTATRRTTRTTKGAKAMTDDSAVGTKRTRSTAAVPDDTSPRVKRARTGK